MPRKLTVQVRYRSREVGVDVQILAGGRLEVRADEPLYHVTPGQGAVFYDGTECLGLGIIQA
jgi:tRNA-specific 2-thiouridylase